MIRVIEATGFLSSIVISRSAESRQKGITLGIHEVQVIANKVQYKNPNVRINLDARSIHAFKCRCERNIVVTQTEICVSNLDPQVLRALRKGLPSSQDIELIKSVL